MPSASDELTTGIVDSNRPGLGWSPWNSSRALHRTSPPRRSREAPPFFSHLFNGNTPDRCGDIAMPKYEKGHPGGPGRPRGSRNAVNLMLDQLAVDGAETVVRKMIEVAAEGDRVAARLVLNRIWSAPKGRSVE